MARRLHGRYTIRGKLADGGMAEIFLAFQHGAEGFEKPVVLKRILTQYSADPQFRNMLLDEAHISMSLQHSNIVQVLDLGEAAGRYFLVLELVDGWDLERILQRAQAASMIWPPALALYVTSQVCRALAYAHAKTREGKPLEIVHRDISPNNVLVSDHGEVKLADFGIAKAGRKREQTAAGVIKGKVAYMSPEQALGGGIDKRSDIFSVGSMLYRMMTDKLPFDAGNDLESLLRVQKAQFAPPQETKPTVGTAVSGIIMRAMRLAPSERYQSADEMLADVERVLRNDFHSAGQTELKLWLEQLGRRDEAESIGKRRLGAEAKGTVKDAIGTDLSAGTSFELDDLEQVATGETEVSQARPGPGARPPPIPPGMALTTLERRLKGDPRPAPPPRRRRFTGFWLGAIFALGAVVGIKYLIGWAQQPEVAGKFGLGPDGAVRNLIAAAEDEANGGKGGGAAGKPAPAGATTTTATAPAPAAPAAPVPSPAAPVPSPAPAPAVAAAPVAAPAPVAVPVPVPPPVPVPVPPALAPVAVPAPVIAAAPAVPDAKPETAPAIAAGEPAHGSEPAAPGEKPAADDEPDEEALLRNAVPNAESAVIGEDEAETPAAPAAAPKPAAAAAKRPAPVVKVAARTPSSRPEPAAPAVRPAPPKPETVVIHISTQPVGAIVRVKSRVLGRTPINLHFKSEHTYEIMFVKRGYQPTTKKVSLVGRKDRKLAVALMKKRPPPAAKHPTGFFHPHR